MSDISDRVFVKNFSLLVGVLAALTVVLLILANMVGSLVPIEATGEAKAQEQAVAERIRPVGQMKVAGAAGGEMVAGLIQTASAAPDGKAVYEKACQVCHLAGVAGAPKLDDKAGWNDRIAQGMDTLYEHAIKGFQGKVGFMPAKGGNASLSDGEVKACVDYMVAQAKK